jgi:hypothetical protein
MNASCQSAGFFAQVERDVASVVGILGFFPCGF